MKTSQDTKKKLIKTQIICSSRQWHCIRCGFPFVLAPTMGQSAWQSIPKTHREHILFCRAYMLSLLSVVLQMQARSLTESHLSETNDSFSRNGMMMGCQGIMKVTILVMYIRVKLP